MMAPTYVGSPFISASHDTDRRKVTFRFLWFDT